MLREGIPPAGDIFERGRLYASVMQDKKPPRRLTAGMWQPVTSERRAKPHRVNLVPSKRAPFHRRMWRLTARRGVTPQVPLQIPAQSTTAQKRASWRLLPDALPRI